MQNPEVLVPQQKETLKESNSSDQNKATENSNPNVLIEAKNDKSASKENFVITEGENK